MKPGDESIEDGSFDRLGAFLELRQELLPLVLGEAHDARTVRRAFDELVVETGDRVVGERTARLTFDELEQLGRVVTSSSSSSIDIELGRAGLS